MFFSFPDLTKGDYRIQHLRHGTSTAGLIAAEANNIFGRGIAFGAELAG